MTGPAPIDPFAGLTECTAPGCPDDYEDESGDGELMHGIPHTLAVDHYLVRETDLAAWEAQR